MSSDLEDAEAVPARLRCSISHSPGAPRLSLMRQVNDLAYPLEDGKIDCVSHRGISCRVWMYAVRRHKPYICMSGIQWVFQDIVKVEEGIPLRMGVLRDPRVQRIPLGAVVADGRDGAQDGYGAKGFHARADRLDVCLCGCKRYRIIHQIINAAHYNDEMRF